MSEGDVYEFQKFLASDGCWSLGTIPSPKYAVMRERALRAEALVREKDEAIGELLSDLDYWVWMYRQDRGLA